MQNLVVISDTVRAHVRGPKFEDAGAPHTLDAGVADSEKHAAPHVLSYQISSL